MEFYERLEQAKKTLKLTNENLGNVIGKKNPDTFRMAVVKRSLKEYDIMRLNDYLDKLENKPETKKPQQDDGEYSNLNKIIEIQAKQIEFLQELLLKK